MSKLKAYTLGISGMPGHKVIEALGLESWVRQCEITPVERSKSAAHALLESRGVFISLSDSEFRLTDDPYVVAMRDAGLLDVPEVYARPMSGGGPVVRLLPGSATRHKGDPELVGFLTRVGGQVTFSREQMPESAR